MAGAADGVAYLYENIGIQPGQSATQLGIAYLYENIGIASRYAPLIGRVIAELNAQYAVAYLYENVT